jgi:hypothetical protein
LKTVKEIKLMRSGKTITFTQSKGWIECTVPAINDFELMLCIYEAGR